MSTVKERLKQVMNELGISPLTPASTCEGITKNMMQKLWASETDTVTTNILEPFCNHYTQVDCNWLMRGVGEMFIQKDTTMFSQKEAQRVALSMNLVDTIKKLMDIDK